MWLVTQASYPSTWETQKGESEIQGYLCSIEHSRPARIQETLKAKQKEKINQNHKIAYEYVSIMCWSLEVHYSG